MGGGLYARYPHERPAQYFLDENFVDEQKKIQGVIGNITQNVDVNPVDKNATVAAAEALRGTTTPTQGGYRKSKSMKHKRKLTRKRRGGGKKTQKHRSRRVVRKARDKSRKSYRRRY